MSSSIGSSFIVNEKVEPCPSFETQEICPSNYSTIAFATTRPSPTPLLFV
jgi:hypothetical protein